MLADKDLVSIQEVRTKVEKAYAAAQKYRHYNQEQVDAIVEHMAAAARGASQRLAEMAVEETGYGNAKDTALPEIWEAQTATLAVPNTGMAVITDIGNTGNIHPTNKQEVGRRLGLVAEKQVYGKNTVASGPTFQSARIDGDKMKLCFARFNL